MRRGSCIVHIFNPLHVMCRMIDLLIIYDRIWSRVFVRKRELTRREAVRLLRLKKKKREIMEQIECLKEGGIKE